MIINDKRFKLFKSIRFEMITHTKVTNQSLEDQICLSREPEK